MDIHNLVKMANRIAEFFEAMPERKEAVLGIAQHIRRYWEPRMRHELLAFIDGGVGDDDGLKPIVREAVLAHRVALGL